MKKYFHKISIEEYNNIMRNNIRITEINKLYKQPKWCNYPNAIHPYGCFSLLINKIKTRNNCMSCDCYIFPKYIENSNLIKESFWILRKWIIELDQYINYECSDSWSSESVRWYYNIKKDYDGAKSRTKYYLSCEDCYSENDSINLKNSISHLYDWLYELGNFTKPEFKLNSDEDLYFTSLENKCDFLNNITCKFISEDCGIDMENDY